MNFTINRFVDITAHGVSRASDGGRFIVDLSTRTDVTEGVRDELKAKLTNLIGNNAKRRIVMGIEDGEFFDMVQKIPEADSELFTQFCQDAARKLAQAQSSHRVPDGVLMVIRAVNNMSQNLVLFIKAEFDTALRAKSEVNNIVSLEMLDKIIPGAKFYKIGAFLQAGKKWQCVLHDDAVKGKDKHDAAKYFYETFLELSFMEEDKDKVLKFFLCTKEFIEQNYFGQAGADKLNVLSVYLMEEDTGLISLEEFADRYMGAKHKSYMSFMISQGVPAGSIRKDTTFVAKFFRRPALYFESGVEIYVRPDRYKSDIHVLTPEEATAQNLGSDWVHVAIKGPITFKK